MSTGSTIDSTDLSSLHDILDTILNGTGVHGGYAQGDYWGPTKPVTGTVIDDSYHDSLYTAAEIVARYYNITNPFTEVDSGTVIDSTHMNSVAPQFITDITTRFNAPWNYNDWDTEIHNEISETVSNWNGSRVLEVKIPLGNVTMMNAWFSAGGEIRVSVSHNDTSGNQQGTSWEQLCSELGTFRYSVRPEDSSSVDTRTRYKYSDLTNSYVVHKKEIANDSDYSANYIEISAYVDDRTGYEGDIWVKVELNDAHVARSGSGSGYGGAWSWTGADTVPGTTTVEMTFKRLMNDWPSEESVYITMGNTFIGNSL